MQTYPTGYAESHRIAEQIFREILPRHGMAVREEQIALCHEVLDLSKFISRQPTLCATSSCTQLVNNSFR